MNTAVTVEAARHMSGVMRETARPVGTAWVSDKTILLVRVFSNRSLVRKNSYRWYSRIMKRMKLRDAAIPVPADLHDPLPEPAGSGLRHDAILGHHVDPLRLPH